MGSAKNAPQIFTNGVSPMPGGRGTPAATTSGYVGAGFGAIPTHGGGRGKANPTGWFVAALVFAAAFGYWVYFVGTARNEAITIRAWAQKTAVIQAANNSKPASLAARRKVVETNRPPIVSAWKDAWGKTSGLKTSPDAVVPPDLMELLENKLVNAPKSAVTALQNAANKREKEAFPFYPSLVTDSHLYDGVKWGLLGMAGLFATIGLATLIPKRRPAFASAVPVPATPAPATPFAPAPGVPISPRIATRPTLSTPFPPPPEAGPAPTAAAPLIRAGVVANGSASAEVTRLVKRLEELEDLSGQLKTERDESRKELTWTQSALDDFKKRVSDATTLATASAAQAAGASEQRAAQAEQRVTEAVEHINEALARAVQTEFGVSRAKELAQTAEERAAHAESRAQETQFQLAKAMERLADLERLAAVTRMGAVGGPVGSSGIPSAPAALPAPDLAAYPNGFDTGETSSIDSALAAAAKNTPRPAEPAPPVATATAYPVAAPAPQPVPPTAPVITTTAPAVAATSTERPPAPRLTTTKMSDIEAGLKLARSIRSRTSKPPTDGE